MLPKVFRLFIRARDRERQIEEAFQLAADYQLAPDDLKPRITCGIEWNLARVIDLTRSNLPPWLKLEDWMQENFSRINKAASKRFARLSDTRREILGLARSSPRQHG